MVAKKIKFYIEKNEFLKNNFFFAHLR